MKHHQQTRRPVRVLALAGSLRRESGNAALLRAAAMLDEPDTAIRHWDGLGTIPPFDEDIEHDTPATVARLRTAISEVDALLIATPEYNGSVPGQLKNAVDWASRPPGNSVLDGLPVAVLSASPSGYGAAWAGEHLATILDIAGAAVLPRGFALPGAPSAFGEDGALIDAEHQDAVRAVLDDLVDAVHRRAAGEPVERRSA